MRPSGGGESKSEDDREKPRPDQKTMVIHEEEMRVVWD
jgi:hypothetical protein